MRSAFICDVAGAGEAIDDCNHARVTIDPEAAAELLKLRPLVVAAEAALTHRFLRLEVIDDLCEFGTLTDEDGNWPGISLDDWVAEPAGLEFERCPEQDVMVMRLDEAGIDWRMVPEHGDESPVTVGTMTWADLEAIRDGRCPFAGPKPGEPVDGNELDEDLVVTGEAYDATPHERGCARRLLDSAECNCIKSEMTIEDNENGD